MKRFNGIIESEFAPASTMDLWLFKGNLKYFGPKGWTGISGGGESGGIEIGDTTGTAYDGGKGAALAVKIEEVNDKVDDRFLKIAGAVGLKSGASGDLVMDLSDTNYMSDATTVEGGLKSLDAQLKPIIIPDASFNIPTNSSSDAIAAIFTDSLVSEIFANGANKKLVLLANNSQQFPLSVQYSNSNGNLVIRLMYVHAGAMYYRQFNKTAAGVWSINTAKAGPIMLTTDTITVPAATTTTVGGVKKAAAMTSLSADAELAAVTAKLNELIQKLKDAGTLDIPVS